MIIKNNNIVLFLVFLLFLFSSFDIFLNLNIQNFSLRAVYLVEILLIFYILNQLFNNKIKYIRFLNGKSLLMWVFFIIIFIPNTTILLRNIGYAIWLLLSISLVAILPTLINNKKNMDKVLNVYILSFKYIALLGILQFSLGILGIDFYIAQWWIEGKIPRINGFSYEPSYYGTYLMIGWTILLYMYIFKSSIFYQYKITFLLITIAIILSSSRMTILIMLLVSICLNLISFLKNIYNFKILRRDIYIIITIIILCLSVIIIVVSNFDEMNFLISGLGIFGTSSHSSSTRLNEMEETFSIFINSPFVGYSLGGIPSARAELNGVFINTQEEAKNFEGMNVFVEVLAASGITGFIFFLSFFFLLFYKACHISSKIKNISYDFSIIIQALNFSLISELLLLSMNQNILRPYLWIHISILSASIFVGRRIFNEKNSY